MSTLTAADTLDLADVGRAVRRGWRAVIAFVILGTAAAVGLILFAPPKFSAVSTIVLRTGNDASASILSRVGGGLGDAGGLLSGAVKSPMETELQILSSRSVVGQVMDSLRLQARVSKPRGVPPNALVDSYALKPSFAPKTYTFTRRPDGSYDVTSNDERAHAAVGAAVALSVGSLTLRPGTAAPQIVLQVRDHEDAIDRIVKHLAVDKAGGEVAKISYAADDSLTAAAVPNSIVGVYLNRRKTTDRGVNQHRVEFLEAKTDSASRALARAERALRQQQEASGVIDPQVVGKIELERAVQLRGSLTEVRTENGAIKQLIARVADGSIQPRELGAYPAFLRSAGINQLLSQLALVETERFKALETRTEKDPEVVALTQSAKHLESQLLPMAQTYSASLEKQQTDYQRELESLDRRIAALPAVAESGLRLQRDVARLGAIYAAMQAQLVEGRLAAIQEGGEVRGLDVAAVPRKPSFPDPVKTLGAGIAGGLGVGLVAALLLGMLGRWMQDPRQVEQSTGFPALRFTHGMPLFLGSEAPQTVLVIPIDARARIEPVAQQIAATALARSLSATILDLSALNDGTHQWRLAATSGAALPESPNVNASIERLEQEHSLVVVQLPPIASPITVAALRRSRPVVLVVPEHRIDRTELMDAVHTLKRLDVPCAGIVLSGNERRAFAL
jgi:tyrosine-protein kinase Etk/Wzc